MLAFMASISHKGQMKITYFKRIFNWKLFDIYDLSLNFLPFQEFQGFKTEYQPLLAFIGCKGQIQIVYSMNSDGKTLPYQFCLASISGL